MKLSVSQLRRIIKEELSRILSEEEAPATANIKIPSAWLVNKGPVPGISAGHETGAVLLVTRLAGDVAYYGIFWPDQKIRDPRNNEKVFDNMYAAVRSVPLEELVENYSGIRGESVKMSVEQLQQVAKQIK